MQNHPGFAEAIQYHVDHESTWRRDFLTETGRYIGVADEPPAPDDVLGPVRPRGGQASSASESCYAARGAGSNVIWADPDRRRAHD